MANEHNSNKMDHIRKLHIGIPPLVVKKSNTTDLSLYFDVYVGIYGTCGIVEFVTHVFFENCIFAVKISRFHH